MGVIKGPTQTILIHSRGTHPDNTKPIYERNALGVVRGLTQIELSPYDEENALGVAKGTHPDNTKTIL